MEDVERPWRSLPPEVAAVLRPFVPETAEEIVAAIRAEIAPYSRPLEGDFGQTLRGAVERALSDFLNEVEEGRQVPQDSERDIYAGLGRFEAREGRNLQALLAAYRVGARVAWRRTAAAGRRAGFDTDTLALLAEGFFAYIDQLSGRSAQGFAEEQSAAAGETARQRRALLALLLQTPPVEPAAVEAAAREARWDPPAVLAVLLWRDDTEQPVAARLPLGSLAAPLDGGLVCAVVPDPDAPGRRAEVERALGRRLGALGPTVSFSEAWRSAERARAVHRLAASIEEEEGGLVAAEERLADLVVHGDPALLRELAAWRLTPLDGRSPASRRRLLETLAAWLDEQGNVARVAEALHVHPQTVRYRLAQLRELFGAALDDPRARFELSLAVRAREDR